MTIEKIIVMLVMLLPFWQSVRWSRLYIVSVCCANDGRGSPCHGPSHYTVVFIHICYFPHPLPIKFGSAMGLDRMPKPVEEGIALLLFPFVVTACWFWLVDSFLLDNEERIEVDPVRSEGP